MGWSLCLTILLFNKGDEKLYFLAADMLQIFISIFILYFVQPPLWIKYLFPPCLNCGHIFYVTYFTHIFSNKK